MEEGVGPDGVGSSTQDVSGVAGGLWRPRAGKSGPTLGLPGSPSSLMHPMVYLTTQSFNDHMVDGSK